MSPVPPFGVVEYNLDALPSKEQRKKWAAAAVSIEEEAVPRHVGIKALQERLKRNGVVLA